MKKIQERESKLPVVAIVGRPNVGKSSLFNVIMHKRISIVHEQAGVTRDRVAMPAYWGNCHFLLVDTGGLGIMRKQKKADLFDLEIRNQLERGLENVDVVILMTDIGCGLTQMDREVAKFIRQKSQQFLVVCNKADNPDVLDDIEEFYQLGSDDVIAISCLHRLNIKELLDKVIKNLPQVEEEIKDNFDLRLSIVGRPNVGKSSLINALLGEQRVIVSDVAGTTRDAIDIPFVYTSSDETKNGTLVDTAGIKRRGKVNHLVDVFSIMRTEEAIKRSSMILFVLDAKEGVLSFDKKIASLILKYGKPCILVINKWDLLGGKKKKAKFGEEIFAQLPFLRYAPLVFTSAVKSTGLENILEKVILINDQSSIKVSTSLVNYVLQDMVARTPPPSTGKGFFKIFYAVMTKNPPASFILFCNRKNYLQKSYLSFIEKQLRKAFSLTGIPIELHLKEREHIQQNYRNSDTIPKDIKDKLHQKQRIQRLRNKKYRK